MTLEQLLVVLAFLGAVGSGLIAGVFYAFSTFVMRALARLPAEQGVAAMQAINVAVINPAFLGVFLGTAVAGAAAVVAAGFGWGRPGAGWMLAGGLLYLGGTFLVTLACNVPLNNGLAKLAPGDGDAARQWRSYVTRWTMWNHVRTAAAVLALACYVCSIRG